MILIVSSPQDVHVQAVGPELDALEVDWQVLDLSSFPARLTLTADVSDDGAAQRLVGPDIGDLALSNCEAIWWRRPQPFGLDTVGLSGNDYGFAYSESQAAFDGLWSSLEDVQWVNDPIRDLEAHRKLYGLQVAQSVGLEVPRTRVTNNPSEAQAFVDEQGVESTVYKAFTATEQSWRETRVLRPTELQYLETTQLAPVIFQEYVPADVDLRVTVIGDEVFPAAIYSQETEYPFDFRMTMDAARMEADDLPDDVIEKLHAFMDRLGLVYGAIDMRRTPDDRHVFLEVNPAGQFLFVEERTGQPISSALARKLAGIEDESG